MHGPFESYETLFCMKKTWIRIGVIIATFFISLIVFSIVLNTGTTDMTIEMRGATLPVVSVYTDGYEVNLMHGYVSDIDMGTLRDSITPLGDDRGLEFAVNTYGTVISKISYEIRSRDGSRLIEDNTIDNYEQQFNSITGAISVKDLIEEGQEYNLVLILSLADGRTARYYTRIIQDNDLRAGEKIQFVHGFNEKTFDKENAKELSTYMETNSEGDNTTFGRVNIHSNINQLSWGDMEPKILGNMKTTVNEIDKYAAAIALEYLISVQSGSITNYYRIEEYYRIRKSTERYYLLSFDRTMSEIFLMEKESTANNKIVLGIQSDKTQLVESPDSNKIAFTNAGRLYSYNITDNKLARLYAYYDALDVDERNIYRNSDIKILNVEETGNVAFMVYGYINRGTHEGEVGILLEYYNSIVNTIEEQAFIPYKKSPKVLIADLNKLSYLNAASNTLYLLIDGCIYSVDVDELESKAVAEDIREDTLFVSNSSMSAIWQAGTVQDVTANLNILNMSEDILNTVPKGRDECIKPIGFMNDDMIYGLSRVDDVIYNTLGDITILMDKVVIRDSKSGDVLKEYKFDGVYVTEGYINNNQISLKRVSVTGDGRINEITDDQITNNDSEVIGRNKEVIAITDLFEKVSQIEVKNTINQKTLKFLTPKEVIYEGGRQVEVARTENKTRFYLYNKGRIIENYDQASRAIVDAYDIRGTVVDNFGNVVYTRGGNMARNQIMAIKEEETTVEKNSLAVCLDVMLKLQGISRNSELLLNRGDSPQKILEDNLPSCYVLNLTEAVMDTSMYYLNRDIPVMALLTDGRAVLLIGYNEQNMVWFDPSSGTIYKQGMNDSRDAFEAAGNRFLTYSIIKEQ